MSCVTALIVPEVPSDLWPPLSARLDATGIAMEVTLQSAITCPECGICAKQEMPTDACIFFYECKACRKLLRPLPEIV